MVMLTDEAVAAVHRAVATAPAHEAVCGMRVMVEWGGCAGLKYMLGMESDALDDDVVYEFGCVKLFVDAESHPMLAGTRIDFVDDVQGCGFVFDNPNARTLCHCGQSFAC